MRLNYIWTDCFRKPYWISSFVHVQILKYLTFLHFSCTIGMPVFSILIICTTCKRYCFNSLGVIVSCVEVFSLIYIVQNLHAFTIQSWYKAPFCLTILWLLEYISCFWQLYILSKAGFLFYFMFILGYWLLIHMV